jgi:hypothetical protein
MNRLTRLCSNFIEKSLLTYQIRKPIISSKIEYEKQFEFSSVYYSNGISIVDHQVNDNLRAELRKFQLKRKILGIIQLDLNNNHSSDFNSFFRLTYGIQDSKFSIYDMINDTSFKYSNQVIILFKNYNKNNVEKICSDLTKLSNMSFSGEKVSLIGISNEIDVVVKLIPNSKIFK